MFTRVTIEGGAVCAVSWPNGADLCSDVVIWGGAPPSDRAARPEFTLSAQVAEGAAGARNEAG